MMMEKEIRLYMRRRSVGLTRREGNECGRFCGKDEIPVAGYDFSISPGLMMARPSILELP